MSKKITDVIAIGRIRKILKDCGDDAVANRVLEFVVDERRHAESQRVHDALNKMPEPSPLTGGPL